MGLDISFSRGNKLFRLDNFSLKAKLIIYYAAILSLTVVILGFNFFSTTKALLIKNKTKYIVNRAKPTIDACTNSYDNFKEIASAITKRLAVDSLSVAVIDKKSRTIASSGKRNIELKARYIQYVKNLRQTGYNKENQGYVYKLYSDNILMIFIPVYKKNKFLGTVLITSSIEDINRTLKKYLSYLGTAAVLTVLISIGVGFLLISSAFSSLSSIVFACNRMAGGDFSARIDSKYGNDEIGRLIKAFDEMAKNVERMIDTQRKFTANAAHELKTPLTSLRGSAEIIEKIAADDPYNVKKLAGNIKGEIDRLNILCDRLLGIAKLEDSFNINKSKTDIREFLHGCISKMTAAAGKRKIILKEGLAVDVYIDEELMRQVIFNIIENAILHTDDEGIIEINWYLETYGVIIKISDNGSGIKDGDLEHIFEPFYKGAEDSKGFGLGLAFSKRIIEAHKGYIKAQNNEKAGASFIITIPFT